MSLRIFERAALGLACLALHACGADGRGSPGGNGSATTVPAGEPDDGKAECAIGPGATWDRNCLVEEKGKLLTLRHPDGGFRRFRIVANGRGLEAADGSEISSIALIGGRRIEISVGDDRYRLPATIDAPRR